MRCGELTVVRELPFVEFIELLELRHLRFDPPAQGAAYALVAVPTLIWDVENRETAAQNVEASYLTAGMNWRADYVLLVNADDTKGDLQGWVTLTNGSARWRIWRD